MFRRIYLAAASSEIARAELWTEVLGSVGIETTSSWIESVRANGGGNPPEASAEDKRRWAENDLAGVGAADLVWLLVPKEYSHGAFFELGYAFHAGKRLVASGKCSPPSIFLALCDGVFASDTRAFDWIVKRSGVSSGGSSKEGAAIGAVPDGSLGWYYQGRY